MDDITQRGPFTWSYRMLRTMEGDEEMFVIVEAFFDRNGDVAGWTSEAAAPSGETPEIVRMDLEAMLKAIDEPPLDGESVSPSP